MSLSSYIDDGYFGHGTSTAVSKNGQLITSPISYNNSYYKQLAVDNQVYNMIAPSAGKRFVIDGIIFSGSKEVSQSDGASIKLYEASSESSAISIGDIFTLDVARLDGRSFTGINLITTQGVWINAFTNDNNVNLTLLGYYIEVKS